MQEKVDEEKMTYLPSGQELRSDFLRQVAELREAVEQQVGPGGQERNERTERPKGRLF